MGNTSSYNEYMEAEKQQQNAQIAAKKQQEISLIKQEAKRDAGMLTQHLPTVNPRTNFTVRQYTGFISPPTKGQMYDVRGLPKSILNRPITEVPGFLQQADRSEAYLDQREISSLQGKRQIEFV